MGKYLDWYLVELERSLDPRTAPEAAFELLNQTEDHISMIKEELMYAGMDDVRAEQAAIQRFGQLDALAGHSTKKEPLVRANWAAPVLLLLGGTAIVGASMVVGSVDSMIAAGALGIASLVISAFLCCRRGTFPGLAFGILLAFCFATLSVIASLEFYGPKLDFVKKTERARLVSTLRASRVRSAHIDHLIHLGEAWSMGTLGHRAPSELRSSEGILSPVLDQWNGYQIHDAPAVFGRYDGVERLFGWSGSRLTLLTSSAELVRTVHSEEAKKRWQDFRQRVPYYFAQDTTERLDQALATLAKVDKYDSDSFFAGIFFGSLVSTFWMLVAFVLNRFASFDRSTARQPERSRPRVARS